MFVKILRWIVGLPLLVGGLSAFAVGVFASPAMIVLALMAFAIGVCLLAPSHLTGGHIGKVDVDGGSAQVLREANPELVGTGAWYARQAAEQCPTATEVWYHNQLTR